MLPDGSVAVGFSAGTGLTPRINELPLGLDEIYARESEVTMKMMAAPVVIFVRNGAGPAPPKIVWDAPPNAAPISAPLPVCSNTISMRAMHTTA